MGLPSGLITIARLSAGDLGQVRRNPFNRSEIRLGDAVVPAEMIFIPERPDKSQKTCPGGNQYPKLLHTIWRDVGMAVKTDHAQAAKHHSGRRATENREQREILRVKQHERCARRPSSRLCSNRCARPGL